MAGNVVAQKALERFAERGKSRDDVYEAIADSIDGLTRFDRAWALGYLARLVDRGADRNPYDRDDEVSGRCRERWAEGWRAGGIGDFEALGERVRELRGEGT